jgi:hypothetical protein
MVTAAELGGLHLLFPQAQQQLGLPPAVTTPADALPAAEEPPAEPQGEATPSTTSPASAVPVGAKEIDDIPEEPAEKPANLYTVTKLAQLDDEYFIETKQGQTFVTNDKGTARSLNDARKSGVEMQIDGEQDHPSEGGKPSPFLRIVECTPAATAGKKY